MRFNKETAAEILRDVADELDAMPEAHYDERLPELLFDVVEALNILRGLIANDPIKFSQINAGKDILKFRNDLGKTQKMVDDLVKNMDVWLNKEIP